MAFFNQDQTVRAPLRWAGSKRKSLRTLQAHAPAQMSRYIEPFAGSACFVFAARPPRVVIGDINDHLIAFYRDLRGSPAILHEIYSSITPTESEYYRVRDRFNGSDDTINKSADFLFLNRYCFNGIYRVNKSGKFNVPWGGEKVGLPLTRIDLENASYALSESTIVCGDFCSIINSHLEPGAFVYLDPPYASDEKRVFDEYHPGSFSTKDWDRLISILDTIHSSGCKFMLSYAGDSPLRERLQQWNIFDFEVTRNVGGFRSSRRKYGEFIATNYDCNLGSMS